MSKPISKEYLANTLKSFDSQVLKDKYVKKEENHTHNNKDVLDIITTEKVAVWDKSEQNVQSDWNEIDSTSDAYIKNKPTSLPSNGGNSDTVNGHTVESDVPENAKFTDTIYDDTDIRAKLANKADITAIPSKVSDLENDSKYQTESDVTTTLTDYATKTYVGEQVTNAEHLKREIVNVLPSDTKASDNIIYMLKVESTTGNDKYQEYMKIDGTVQMVGDTSVDLTDYAKSTDIPTTVAQLTDSASYAKKTEIPTTLPANGGNADTVNNHTVETDVPTDAKFTDTVYDDTEVKGSIDELSSNLVQLEFGENSGTDNLATIKSFSFTEERVSSNGYNWIKLKELAPSLKDGDVVKLSFNGTNINNDEMYLNGSRRDWMNESIITIQESDLDDYLLLYGKQNMLCTYDNIMITKNVSLTEYEPYIPSVKMLADKTTQIDDLNVLGWVVPEEMPIKNYVDSDGVFHQRVGRVDLGSLDWAYNGSGYLFYTPNIVNAKSLGCAVYSKFKGVTGKSYNSEWGILLNDPNYNVTYINASGYTDLTTFKNDMQGVYLYYELEEENLIKVDGNEAVTRVNESLGDYGLNNVYDGQVAQGYCNYADGTFKFISQDSTFVGSIHGYSCKSGDVVKFKLSRVFEAMVIQYNDKTWTRKENVSEAEITIPANVTEFCWYVQQNGVATPQNIGHVGIYINNAIAELKQDLDALTNYHTEKTLIGKFCGLNHYRNVYTGVINNSSGMIHIPHGIATSKETAYATNFSAYGCKIFPELDGNAYIVDLKDNVWFDLSSGSNEIALKYPDSENCEFNYTIIIEYAIEE